MRFNMSTVWAAALLLIGASGCTKRDSDGGKASPASSGQALPGAEPSPAPLAEEKPKLERLSVRIEGAQVKVSWSAPPGTPLVRVVRSLNAAPSAPGQGSASPVYMGAGNEAAHPVSDLLPDDPSASSDARHEYHYAAFACQTADACEGPPARATLRATLLECLRAGGYVIHWRHSTADVCQDVEPLGTAADTQSPGWWKSCESNCDKATARQLGSQGVAEAKQLGAAMARLQIPIARLVSAEFCRAVQTAEHMALRHAGKPVAIETAKELTSFVYDEKNRCSNVYKLIAQPPAAGTNVALIGQKGNECPVIGGLESSAAAIFRPDGAGGAKLVRTLKWTDWAGL